jgi:porphobilinogen synthase
MFRDLFAKPFPEAGKFIWPVFIIEGTGQKIPIDSMPGQFRYSIDVLIEDLNPLCKLGIGGIMLFGVVSGKLKNLDGSYAYQQSALVQEGISRIKRTYPDLLIFTDVCMCEYTSHGHCGILSEDGIVLNDATLDILGKIAVSHAIAGADVVAPSSMMDGQVGAIRKALDLSGFTDTAILSYSTKFASSMYGPFRDAADSSPSSGDRKSYQLPYDNVKLALRESLIDESEGADMLMVKPALFYLDIILELSKKVQIPLAAYNVSGEYSMIYASSNAGYGDLYSMARESLMSINRAGSEIILSYWANQYEKLV